MAKLLEMWRKLGIFAKLAIFAIPLCVILFTWDCVITDWSEIIPDEEGYVALEELAYEIIETKNITLPLSENLESYTVDFNADGTINIKLYGKSEILRIKLSENYEIKSFTRGNESIVITIIAVIILVLITYFFVAWIIFAILYAIVLGIKKIYLFFKK